MTAEALAVAAIIMAMPPMVWSMRILLWRFRR